MDCSTRSSNWPLRSLLRDLGLRITATFLVVSAAVSLFAACGRIIATPGYSVCIPNGWTIYLQNKARIVACKPSKGQCLKNKDDHPYPGALIVDITSADGVYRSDWETPQEIVSRAKKLGESVPTVSDVTLKSDDARRSGWVARALNYGDLWEETYGLSVGQKRFTIRVQYNNEPANIEQFRSDVRDILSSVMPR